MTTADSSVTDASSESEGAMERSEPLPPALAACVARNRAMMPPELALALNALEFQSVVEDGCRLRQAVQFADPTLCERITVRALRGTCTSRAAIAAGRPEICPPAELDRGRDPFCVALAARLPGLCAATRWADRARCLAAAHQNAAECDALDPLLRPQCRDETEAFHGTISATDARPFVASLVQLGVGTEDAGTVTDAGPPRSTLVGTERGAFADRAGNLYVVDPMVGWPPDDIAWARAGTTRVGLIVHVPSRGGHGRVLALRLILPDGRLFLVDATHAAVSSDVVFRRAAVERGASVSGIATLHVRPRSADSPDALPTGDPAEIVLSFHTFVRDVVEPAALGVPAEIVPPPVADE